MNTRARVTFSGQKVKRNAKISMAYTYNILFFIFASARLRSCLPSDDFTEGLANVLNN